jgi:hypothetical protein
LLISFAFLSRHETAESIIKRAIDSHGGLERWHSFGGMVEFDLRIMKLNNNGEVSEQYSALIRFPTSGEPRYEGIINGIQMKYLNGETEVWNDENVPQFDQKLHEQASYVLPTMNYILALPWKLADDGVFYEKIEDKMENGTFLTGVLIRFGENIGEYPEDWYRFYFDKETGRLHSVLFEEHHPMNPAIIWLYFRGKKEVNGFVFPEIWDYYEGFKDGTQGKHLKTVYLNDVHFIK